MPQLDPTFFASQLFWLALSFLILYVLLAKLLLPPFVRILTQREQTVTGDLEQAQSMKSQAEHARIDYERTLADSRERAQQTITNAMAKQKVKAEADGKAMDKKIEKKLAEASETIAAKKQELIASLMPTTGELTALIVEKLVSHKPAGDQVSRVLAELSKGRA